MFCAYNLCMIQHILLFKFNEGTQPESIRKIRDKFFECREKLPGFESMQFGENISSKKHLGAGYTHAAIMNFRSKEDIDAYNSLDEHKEAQELQKPHVKDVLVLDIKAS